MAESTDHDNLPQTTAVPKRRQRISIVWIIPILAAVVTHSRVSRDEGDAIDQTRSHGGFLCGDGGISARRECRRIATAMSQA
jgi:hypothetical protein